MAGRRPLRVLVLFPSFGVGGAQTMVVHLATSLPRDGFEVRVVTLSDRFGTAGEAILDRAGVPVVYLGKRLGPDVRMCPGIGREMRAFRPDVVSTHLNVLPYALPAWWWNGRVPTLHTIHNVAGRDVESTVGRLLNRWAFGHGIRPVAIGEEVAQSIEKVYGVQPIETIPYGVPVSQYQNPPVSRSAWRDSERIDPQALVFGTLARLDAQKNLFGLLEAFAAGPARHGANAVLLIAGSGPLLGPLEARAASLGIDGQVRFLGVRSDIDSFLSAIDVFVLSSDWEGNPLALMEAMSAGCMPICTAVGGVPELIEDGVSGVLIPAGDMQQLGDRMWEIGRDPALRQRMGDAAHRRALEKADVRVMAHRYGDLFRRMAENGGL